MITIRNFFLVTAAVLTFAAVSMSQATAPAKTKEAVGSETAKNGFRNEDNIRDKFNAWQTDADARNWLVTLGYKLSEIETVSAVKPHGEKSDVEVSVKAKGTVTKRGISIKLVSNSSGFNQIDKRWLSHYAAMWKMPKDVEEALKLFTGETLPAAGTRDPKRTYLNELTPEQQTAVVKFFEGKRDEIVSDLFGGDGSHAAGWIMVAFKPADKTDWVLKPIADAIRFFGDGKIQITRAGNLKIGRITMQRKGGDGGRETAKMLQFKIDPAQLFDLK